MSSNTPALACPKCHSALDTGSSHANCHACGTEYPVEGGVLCTDRNNGFLGEFGTARMKEYIHRARNTGWQAIAEEMINEDPSVKTILLGTERATFIDLLTPPTYGNILDLGAGMGAISLQLSKRFNRVFSLDLTFERLAFLQVISEQKAIDNITPICHQDVFRLPFASASLDAVVMVGVFEYFPLSYPELSVEEVQRLALAEINRVLAPGGVLFIGTKNRFGWPNWTGAKDNSGLRFGPLLPRWLADLISKARFGSSFRVITDSFWQYHAILDKAGFSSRDFYWPVNGYQDSQTWVNLSDDDRVRLAISEYPAGKLKRQALLSLAALGAFKYCVPHFGILAKKPIAAAL